MHLYSKRVPVLCVKISAIVAVIMTVIVRASSSNGRNLTRHLRPVIVQLPPYNMVTRFPNGSFEAVGSAKMALEWLAVRMKFKFDLLTPTLAEVNERGQEAPLVMVANGQADFCMNAFAGTPWRNAHMEFTTYPLWEEGYRMVVPRPGEQDRLFAFIDPFDSTVWALTGMSFVVISLFMGLLAGLNARYTTLVKDTTIKGQKKVSDYLGKYFLYNINVLTSHGDYLSESNMSFLVCVVCWLLGASILVYGYSSLVVSSITWPKQKPSVNTFEEVLAHPDISLILRTDTYIGNAINASNDIPLYKALREKAAKRPESIGSEGVINTTKLLLTGKHAYPFLDTAVRFIVSTLYLREKKCRLRLSNPLPLPNGYFYNGVQKGNLALTRELSIAIMQLAETGLVRQYVKSLPWIPKADKCFTQEAKKTTNQTSIKLIDLSSAFLILCIGTTIAAVAFLFELCISYIKGNAKNLAIRLANPNKRQLYLSTF